MRWLQPLSPILGWNGGNEFKTTRLSSVFGHIQTATDWCLNLPLLMAGSERYEAARVRAFDPREINWADQRSTVAFVGTDGDNVQWFEGSFFGHSSYWGNSKRGRIPFGWSCCLTQLVQLCPPAVDYAAATQTPKDDFVEWGGGYYYPDLFGQERADRWQLLAQHARRTWSLMQRSNTRVLGVIVARHDSADALKAYQVLAKETAGMLGILAVQYVPYEVGAGKQYWVKDSLGAEVPVLTARYALWAGKVRPRRGTPARIAHELADVVAKAASADLPLHDWVVAHAWSHFRRNLGADEKGEDMPQGDASQGGAAGYDPVCWCVERLPATVRAVTPEELLWRIRMRHAAQETKKLIQRFQP
jgi:hypothetical protein